MFHSLGSTETTSESFDKQLKLKMIEYDCDLQNIKSNYPNQTLAIEYVDVVLYYTPENAREYIPNIPVRLFPNGDLDINSLIKNLKSLGFPLHTGLIYFYSYSTGLFLFCGQDPLPSSMNIPARDVLHQEGRNIITLKVRMEGKATFTTTQVETKHVEDLELQAATYIDIHNNVCEEESDGFSDSTDTEKKGRTRHKERKISEVLDLVLRWRMLYAGVRDSKTGKIIKLSLEDAAKKLGVAKKSLDDYLLQIRHAKMYGFDFQANHNEKIGVMRTFVKKFKGATNNKFSDVFSEGSIFDSEEEAPVTKKCKKTKKIKKGL